MSSKIHDFVVNVKRRDPNQPWGIRIVGGADLDMPIIITRVLAGSPAAHCDLNRGDVITKIEDYDSRDLRHEDAQILFQNAGNTIKFAVQRDASSNKVPTSLSNGSSRCSPAQLGGGAWSPAPSQNSATNLANLTNTIYGSSSPSQTMDRSYHVNQDIRYNQIPPSSLHQQEVEEEHQVVLNQFKPAFNRDSGLNKSSDENTTLWPYRTTPLVLPGAKVKKDSGPTDCYLRHHPNPAMRASPHAHVDHHDVLMKQKVADTVIHRVTGEEANNKVVHKQFNSPIGLYSDSNIADTIRRDTGPLPLYEFLYPTSPRFGLSSRVPFVQSLGGFTINNCTNKPELHTKIAPEIHVPRYENVVFDIYAYVVLANIVGNDYKPTYIYDPAKSETYRALQEESYGGTVQEVTAPAHTKVFQPNRAVPSKKPVPYQQPAPQQSNIYVNSLGEANETIHQSGSFKRLMYHVLSETDY